MDNGDSGPGAQWMAPDLHDKMQKSRRFVLSFDGARRENGLGAAAWILWLQDEFGIFEKVSNGGRVLRNASAMIAEREALRMGIEHLTVLFPTEVSSFDFQVECTGRTVQYKLNAQSLRLFGLHRDVNDAHRASANRLQNKNKIHTYIQWGSVLRAARNTTPACSSLCVSQPCLPFSVVRRQGSTAVCGPSCLVVPSVRTLRRLDEVSPHAFFLSSFFFFEYENAGHRLLRTARHRFLRSLHRHVPKNPNSAQKTLRGPLGRYLDRGAWLSGHRMPRDERQAS